MYDSECYTVNYAMNFHHFVLQALIRCHLTYNDVVITMLVCLEDGIINNELAAYDFVALGRARNKRNCLAAIHWYEVLLHTKNTKFELRVEAMTALGYIGVSEAVPVLIKVLEDT